MIDRFQSSVSPKGKGSIGKIIEYICDYYLISKELLFTGSGEIYKLADPYHDEFLKDDGFLKQLSIPSEELTTMAVLKAYAEYRGIKSDDILVTQYAQIEYRGSYQILYGKKYAAMRDAVDNLLDKLFLLQNQ